MKLLLIAVLLLAVSTPTVWPLAAAQRPESSAFETLTYGEWSDMSVETRREVFLRLSPQRKAHMIRAHILEWKRIHAGELSGFQLDCIEEALNLVTPALYSIPAQKNQPFKEFLTRLQSAFLPEQIGELFFLDPKQ